MNNLYKKENHIYKRIQKSNEKIHKYPDKIPLILQKYDKDKILFDLPKKQFLVPTDITLSHLIFIIRKQFQNFLDPTIAIYLFSEKGNILCSSDLISKIYDIHKDEDRLLYLFYCGENTFGLKN